MTSAAVMGSGGFARLARGGLGLCCVLVACGPLPMPSVDASGPPDTPAPIEVSPPLDAAGDSPQPEPVDVGADQGAVAADAVIEDAGGGPGGDDAGVPACKPTGKSCNPGECCDEGSRAFCRGTCEVCVPLGGRPCNYYLSLEPPCCPGLFCRTSASGGLARECFATACAEIGGPCRPGVVTAGPTDCCTGGCRQTQGPYGVCCLTEQAACTSDSACCSGICDKEKSVCCRIGPRDNGNFPASNSPCCSGYHLGLNRDCLPGCGRSGALCDSVGGCCAGARCLGGVCCAEAGSSCEGGCCPGTRCERLGPPVQNGMIVPGTCVESCQPAGQPCNDLEHCCAGLHCGDQATCLVD